MNFIRFSKIVVLAFLLVQGGMTNAFSSESKKAPKKWTMLIYINGFNNLDSYGAFNLNQAEKFGSTDDVNVVAQWASTAANDVKRLKVIKDSDTKKVTSPILENLGIVDMGSSKTLVEFVRWAVKKYPAEHYMLDVWNHGGGWHKQKSLNFSPTNISYDDISGNSISTPQLGEAMKDIAAIIGHKLDIYASDACLMNMVEIANEMKDSVSVFAGSEETIPGEGWPYDFVVQSITEKPDATPAEFGKMISKSFQKYYSEVHKLDSTFSAINLEAVLSLNEILTELGSAIAELPADQLKKAGTSMDAALSFAYSDYKDIGDIIRQLVINKVEVAHLADISSQFEKIKQDLVISNDQTGDSYAQATGLSIWAPDVNGWGGSTFSSNKDKYSKLKFNADTHQQWLKALTVLRPASGR